MGLRRFYPNQSLADLVWHYLVYLEARLLSDADAKDLAPKITAMIEQVEKAWQAQRTKSRNEIVMQAQVDAINYQLDRQTERFSRNLLSKDDIAMNTAHPRFARYFSMPVSRFIRQALGPQMKLTRPWVESIKTEVAADTQAFAPIFASLITRGEDAIKRQEDAISAKKDYRVRDITQLIKQLNDTCREVYGILVSRAPSLNQPPEWPDEFFYTPRNASAPDAATLYHESLYNILKARGLEISEATSEKIDETKEEAILQSWIQKALTAKTAEEVVGLAAPHK